MSIVRDHYGGERVSVAERHRITDPEYLRARDVQIVKLREGIYPYRRPHKWREIGPKIARSHVLAWKRYRALIIRHPRALEDIRAGLWD